MPFSLTGAFGGPSGYSSLPDNPECDKELLKLLPELKRISLSELDYLFSLRDGLVQMATEMGIDMYEDDEETLPEEIQRYWACFRAWAQYADLIAYIEACKSQQGNSCAKGWWSTSRLFTKGKKKSLPRAWLQAWTRAAGLLVWKDSKPYCLWEHVK